jgi:hypothetical protein
MYIITVTTVQKQKQHLRHSPLPNSQEQLRELPLLCAMNGRTGIIAAWLMIEKYNPSIITCCFVMVALAIQFV